MKRLGIAVIGLGRVGRACVEAARETGDMRLAGIVRRPEKVAQPLPEGWRDLPVAAHISELRDVDAALICVPTDSVLGTAQQLLQQRIPIVECATLEGPARDAHRDEIGRLAEHHRVPAIVGAGWECGTLPLFKRLFELLIPKGRTEITNRPGVSLHHTSAAQDTKGVRGALCTELRGANGRMQRYVYVELEQGANLDAVSRAIRSDPLFVAEETLVFQVASLAELEQGGHGILMERRGASGRAAHHTLLLEARFHAGCFTAQVMLDAARSLPGRRPGAYAYTVFS